MAERAAPAYPISFLFSIEQSNNFLFFPCFVQCIDCCDSHWARCSCRSEGDSLGLQLGGDYEEEETQVVGESNVMVDDEEGQAERKVEQEEDEEEEDDYWGIRGEEYSDEEDEEWIDDDEDDDETCEPRNIRLRVDQAAAFRSFVCMHVYIHVFLQRHAFIYLGSYVDSLMYA